MIPAAIAINPTYIWNTVWGYLERDVLVCSIMHHPIVIARLALGNATLPRAREGNAVTRDCQIHPFAYHPGNKIMYSFRL